MRQILLALGMFCSTTLTASELQKLSTKHLFTQSEWTTLRTDSSVVQSFETLSDNLQSEIAAFLSSHELKVLKRWLSTAQVMQYHRLHSLGLSDHVTLLSAADKLGMESLMHKLLPYASSSMRKEIERLVVLGEKDIYKIIENILYGNGVLKQLIVERIVKDDTQTYAQLFSNQTTDIKTVFFSNPLFRYDVSGVDPHKIVWIDGQFLFVLYDDAIVPDVMQFDRLPSDIVLNSSGDTALLYFYRQRELCLIDLRKKLALWTIELDSINPVIVLSPSARQILIQNDLGYISIFNVTTGRWARSTQCYNSVIESCYSQDEQQYAIRCVSGAVYLLLITNEKVTMMRMQTKHAHDCVCPSFVRSLMFHPKNGTLIGIGDSCNYIEFEPYDQNANQSTSNQYQINQLDCSWIQVHKSHDNSFFIVSDSAFPSIKANIHSVTTHAAFGSRGHISESDRYAVKGGLLHFVSTDKTTLSYCSLKPFSELANAWKHLSLVDYIAIKRVLHAYQTHKQVNPVDQKIIQRLNPYLQTVLDRIKTTVS